MAVDMRKYASKKIPDDVLGVLSRCTVEGVVLKLPEQLERPAYVAVNKVLEGLGGKWNRKSGGHVFTYDPTDALENALMTGSFVNEKVMYQAFFTPESTGRILVDEAQLENQGLRILEPCCGEGHLAQVILEAMTEPHCTLDLIELNERFALTATAKLKRQVMVTDFLTFRRDMLQSVFVAEPGRPAREAGAPFNPYDRIIANPPFTGKQDIEFMTEMFACLAPGGRVVSAASLSVKFGEDKRTKEFRALVESVGGRIEPLPDESFKESGTSVRACYVVMDKPEG
jgi:SAM-dependent methyltransferase